MNTFLTRKIRTRRPFGLFSVVPALLISTLLATLVASADAQSDFTVIALPDTQYYSESYPQTFTAQTQWIVNNAAALNIQAVLGLGDIVNTATNTVEWQNADASIKLLDNANIPYLLAIGNHDYSDSGNSSGRTSETTNFNTYFGPSRYQSYSWYKGQYPAGSNENFYGILTINGNQYLFLMLEFYPRDSALAWAASVIAANPAAEVIVVTHAYIYSDSTRVSLCDGLNAQAYNVGADNDGEALWKKFVSQYSQISLVLNGHFAYTDSTAQGVGKRVDLGVNGNIVNEMLSDYQEMTNGGNGYLRILKFRPSLNIIEVSTYSPTLNAYLTDSNNQFTVQWHSAGTPPSGSGTVGGQVQSVSCSAISGATISTSGGSASTDTSGNFSLTLPAPAPYTATAQSSGYASGSDALYAWTSYPDSVKYFLSAQQPGSISGQVTSTSGAGIFNATVWYSGGTANTDSSGNYTFNNVPVGTYTVTASQNGYQTSSNQNVSVSSQNSTSSNLVLTPTSTGNITGTVTNAAGTAISNAIVSYSGGSATATTNSNGGYTLSVAPGSYAVTAAASGYQSVTQQNVSVTTGAAATVNFSLQQSTGTISGTVTNTSGTAVPNATVAYSGSSGTATTNSSGAYILSAAPGTYSVTVTAIGYLSSTQQNVIVTNGATTTVNVSLAQSSGTAMATVQSADTYQSGAASLSLAYPTTPTAGNTLIAVGISSGLSGTTLTVSDNNQQAWQSAFGYVTNPNTNGQVMVWFVSNCVGQPTTVTVSLGGVTHNIHMQIFEVSGLATNPVDATGTSDSGSVSVTTQTVTTTGAVMQGLEYALATTWTWNCSGCTPTITKDPNYSILLQSPNPGGGDFVLSEARMQSAASGAQSATIGSSIPYQYATALVTFKGGTGTQGGAISGNVTNAAGAPIANVTVAYSGGPATATTNSSGAYTLNVNPGTYSVTAAGAGYQSASEQDVTVTNGGATNVNFSLAPSTSTISGTVTNAAGTGIVNATVSYSGGTATATTNSSGAYTLTVASGTYSVTATAAGYQSLTQQNVSITSGATATVNFNLAQSFGTISGTVTNAGVTGIANATVSYSGGTTTGTTNSSGGYSITVAPGTYTVTFAAAGYQTVTKQNVTVAAGATTTLNASLSQSPGTISGTVTNATGAGIANATVSYSGGTTTATTSSSGGYSITVAPGTYTVTFSATGYQTATKQNISVAAGAITTLNVSLAPSPGTIAGKVTNASGTGITNATVSYSGGIATATTNSSGAYTLSVAPGMYTVTFTAAGYQTATKQNVSVATGATTTVNISLVQSPGTIAGKVTNASGAAIANATVSYSGGTAKAVTTSTGAYTLSVAAGTYSLTVKASGYVSSTKQNVSVAAGGTTSVNFSLKR